ncbi:MAG: TRAP transporter small permease, partial [Clostridiales bacterium]|nr:TRAP transporter small permease [Clostridiales bacterium]
FMEDVTSFGCFWLVFSGAAVAFRDRSHVTVDLLVTYLGPKPRHAGEVRGGRLRIRRIQKNRSLGG